MKDQITVGDSMVQKVAKLFAQAVEDGVTGRTKKYKKSNDSLRKEMAATKKKLEGAEAEFKPQVERARAAEKQVEHLQTRVEEANTTVQALQTQNIKLKRENLALTQKAKKT